MDPYSGGARARDPCVRPRPPRTIEGGRHLRLVKIKTQCLPPLSRFAASTPPTKRSHRRRSPQRADPGVPDTAGGPQHPADRSRAASLRPLPRSQVSGVSDDRHHRLLRWPLAGHEAQAVRRDCQAAGHARQPGRSRVDHRARHRPRQLGHGRRPPRQQRRPRF